MFIGYNYNMKLENEDALDNFIICQQCFTLHEEIPIPKAWGKACCFECGAVLYKDHPRLVEHGLALSMTGLIVFVLANIFPLVQIEILGTEQYITIPKTILALFKSGFYIVGVVCAFLILIFPLLIFISNILLFMLLKMKRGKNMSKALLILLAHIMPWSMTDIFLVSILVALVKLIGYAQIYMGVSFWALLIFVLIDIYIIKNIRLSDIWMLRKNIYTEEHRVRNR